MDRKVSLLLMCLLPVTISLYLYEHEVAKSNHDNGFRRLYIPHPLGSTKTIDLQYNSYYIAGLSDGQLYLGNRTVDGLLLKVGADLEHPRALHYRLPQVFTGKESSSQVSADHVYFSSGNHSLLMAASLLDTDMARARFLTVPFFTGLCALDSTHLVLRTYNRSLHRSTLSLIQNNLKWVEDTTALRAEGDGYFGSAGSMSFDASTGIFCYCYRFCNRTTGWHSHLTRLWDNNTIDTISRPHFAARSYRTANVITTTYSDPPIAVNLQMQAANGHLFVQSNLRGTGQATDLFDKNFVFDVYDNRSGKYEFSMNIPNNTHRSLTSFAVNGTDLYVLTENFLTHYHMEVGITRGP